MPAIGQWQFKIENFQTRPVSCRHGFVETLGSIFRDKQSKRSNYSSQHDDIGVSFGPKELILQVLLLFLLSFHCVDCECVRRESTGINRGSENQQP